ncbi:hypothetical protein OH809_44990 (plasmid) [Streptomyces sp. NBC_00873]|uniref:hypothetical protein n=1 Tax=Streptomyces sp. NBC_00873 TaxID=2975852 RepID=UPI0037DD1011|nr:hypothetical protein OH809_44990 [Streptomyces sp. NBC_00873]
MASDAINPAVPGPSDPADANAPGRPASGLIASMLAPVAPARPTFDLTAPTGAEGATDEAVTGVSSAAYHGTEEGPQQDTKTAAAAQKKGIWRAWLLAGAARWAKGGGTQNKRLDMKKAKAAAQQVKETRTVSINRSPAPVGRGSSATGSAGKSLNSKGNSGGAVKGPKNSSGKASQGPAGRSGGGTGSGSGGSGGRGPSGGSRAANGPTAGRGGSASPKGSKVDASGGRAPKPAKADLTKGSTSSGPKGSSAGGSAGGKNGAPGPAGSTGKNGGAGTSGSAGGSKGSGSGSATDGKSGKTPAAKDSPGSKDTKQAPTQSGKQANGKGSKDGKDSEGAPGTTPAKTNGKAKVDLNKGKPQTPAAAGQKTTQTGGKPFSTRESRETGYRDGTRAARAAAHTKAYRDGVKDGWADTTQAADREKTRLDQAHQARIKARDEEKPVTGTQTSADYHQPQPIGVKEVTASHVVLGDGAAKDSMTRAEVRSLKSFERRLTAKSDSMTKVAEMTKGLYAHAEEQARKATNLLEAAKAVEGGEKLAAKLARLEEAAKIQADKAKEIHKRAIRAAEACAVVLTNAETRYGGMYKAVVDSDETCTAELHFYKDQG